MGENMTKTQIIYELVDTVIITTLGEQEIIDMTQEEYQTQVQKISAVNQLLNEKIVAQRIKDLYELLHSDN